MRAGGKRRRTTLTSAGTKGESITTSEPAEVDGGSDSDDDVGPRVPTGDGEQLETTSPKKAKRPRGAVR